MVPILLQNDLIWSRCVYTHIYVTCMHLYANSHIHMDLYMYLCASSSAYVCAYISTEIERDHFNNWHI